MADNPHAFPFQASDDVGMHAPEYGMSLRDWFAGQALAGLAGNMRPDRERAINNHDAEADWEATLAYRIADAMLAERGKSA